MEITTPMQRKFISINGFKLSYLHWEHPNENAPVLVFSHANGMNALTYRQMLAPLSNSFTIYALDHRGHGQSEEGLDGVNRKDWEIHKQDLAAFLQWIGKPVLLAGHSMGAVVSLRLVAEGNEFAEGLFLIDPVMFPPAMMLLFEGLKQTKLAWKVLLAKKALRRRAIWPDAESLYKRYRGRGAFRNWSDEALRDYIEGGTRKRDDGRIELTCSPEWEAEGFALLPTDTWRFVRRIKLPITLIRGKRSDTFLPPCQYFFKALNRKTRTIAVKGASHFVALERPHLIRSEIRKIARTIFQ